MSSFEHLAMGTDDIAATIEFLRTVFEGEIEVVDLTPGAPDDEKAVVVRTRGGFLFDIFGTAAGAARPDPSPRIGILHYAITVADVDVAHAAALAAGGVAEIPPKTAFERDGRPDLTVRHAYLRDPNGNLCELVTQDWLDKMVEGGAFGETRA